MSGHESGPPVIDSSVFEQVKRIHIRTRRLVDDVFAGEYHSIFKGRGIDFTEVREYSPGDDVRSIDWNVTARAGTPYVKQYVEERELTVMLLIDMSASGQFASGVRRKRETFIELAAVFALSALRNNDKVGLALFTDRVERFVAPQKGRNRIHRIIREMLHFRPQHRGTDVGAALTYLSKVIRRRTVSFLVSDFESPAFENPLRRACGRHDVIPVDVHDPHERRLPDVGLLALRDLESATPIVVDTRDPRMRREFEDRMAAAAAARRRLFASLGMDSIEIRTDEPFVRPLMRFFRRRERRLLEGR